MSEPGFSVLHLGEQAPGSTWAVSPLGPFTLTHGLGLDNARQYDAVVIRVSEPAGLAHLERGPGFSQAAFDTAVVVLVPAGCSADSSVALLRAGAQDVLARGDDFTVARAVRHAIERKRLERAARHAYATDLATGLPHQAQLLEHMNHLLALRERAPAPLVLIVLHLQGFALTVERLGAEAANVLRRKLAVRLRAGLRASDVVASIGPEAFGVLLGHVEALNHGDRVVAKLARSMQQPFQVAGQACGVRMSIGMALYPEHGKDASSLLQRASAQATSRVALGPDGPAPEARQRGLAAAANDDTVT